MATCHADTVTLKNGDRLSGQVEKMEDLKLVLKTTYAGVLEIDWPMVVHLTTTRRQEIEMKNGLRVSGAVTESQQGLEVASASGVSYLSPSNVVHMAPAGERGSKTFWQHISGELDAGYNVTRGNSRSSEMSVSMNTVYRTPHYKLEVDFDSLFSHQRSAASTNWQTGSSRFDVFLGPRAFVFALGGLERDERELLELRSHIGGGLGWNLLNSERANIALLGGMNALNEDFGETVPAGTQGGRSGEALLGLNVQNLVMGPFRASTKIAINPNLVDVGRYRMAIESGLRLPLLARLTWHVRFFDRFDSGPPRNVKRSDYGVVSGLGFTF